MASVGVVTVETFKSYPFPLWLALGWGANLGRRSAGKVYVTRAVRGDKQEDAGAFARNDCAC